jgi:hypothetical protein
MRLSGYVNGNFHNPCHGSNYFKDVMKQRNTRVEVVLVRIPEVGSTDMFA